MDKVKINRLKLLEIVTKNRDAHVQDYKAAIIGFQKEYCSKLQKALEEAQEKSPEDIAGYVSEDKPKNYVKYYDTLIKKLELSVDENVELDHSQFAQYVMDDWQWKDVFNSSIAKYNVR